MFLTSVSWSSDARARRPHADEGVSRIPYVHPAITNPQSAAGLLSSEGHLRSSRLSPRLRESNNPCARQQIVCANSVLNQDGDFCTYILSYLHLGISRLPPPGDLFARPAAPDSAFVVLNINFAYPDLAEERSPNRPDVASASRLKSKLSSRWWTNFA
ncbi:hypothetical protein EVAR_23014_1 [Eumeta japonica]|uniref:Uncharacterized protein n=1 Tax=Eumeta variegata TaxID=151549 RepID=A0A4C1UQD7_EUMVA|nr:hypothetical protein EVAR_23014_1 [Eumeta japonica]